MSELKKAVEDFREEQKGVYAISRNRLESDANSANKAESDHINRWLFELLQNCDDAKAELVQICLSESTLYIADNGEGLKPSKIRSISSTDLSDKSGGTIGRKGIGFKAVYNLSDNPKVVVVDEGCVEFNRDKARHWLKGQNLPTEHIPFQWIPFFAEWHEAMGDDPFLDSLRDYKTVVVLPGLDEQKIEAIKKDLSDWQPYALFAFRHLKSVSILGNTVSLTGNEKLMTLTDERHNEESDWLVTSWNEQMSEEVLATLDERDRTFIQRDGVGYLVAARRENDIPCPVDIDLNIHVFYATDEPAPIPLLLHAEYLVKSDRTALIPIKSSVFHP